MDVSEVIKKKLFEQPLIVIVMVGLMYWQNSRHESELVRLQSEKDSIYQDHRKQTEEEKERLKTRADNLVEAIKRVNTEHEEELKELYERIIDCEKRK